MNPEFQQQVFKELRDYSHWFKNLSEYEKARNNRVLRKIKYNINKSYASCDYLFQTLHAFYEENKKKLSDSSKMKIEQILHEIDARKRDHMRKKEKYRNENIGDCIVTRHNFEKYIKTLNSDVLYDIFERDIRTSMDKLSDSKRSHNKHKHRHRSLVHVWKKFLRFLRVGKHGKKSKFGEIYHDHKSLYF